MGDLPIEECFVSTKFMYKGCEITLDDAYSLGITTSDLIAEYDAWLHKRSGQLLRTHDHPDHDDLVQEGRIGMWHGFDKFDARAGALPSWLTTHANWRMKEVLSRKAWTGMPSRAGKKQEDITVLRLDLMLDDEDGVEALMVAADLADSAMWAYHRGEIARALDGLTPGQRRYVYLRFWAGVGEATSGRKGAGLAEFFGYSPTSMWSNPTHGARARLQRELAHLR